jgi:two-component system chemotaxis response regulator CheY
LEISHVGGATIVQNSGSCIIPKFIENLGAPEVLPSGDQLGESLLGVLDINPLRPKEDLPKGMLKTHKKVKCLIVDDSPLLRNVIKFDLLSLGQISFFEAENGLSALKQLKEALQAKDPFELVICDRHMPEMTGQELLLAVRKDKGMLHLPFIMVTGEADRDKIMESIRAGVTDYVTKPVSGDILRNKVITILKLNSKTL